MSQNQLKVSQKKILSHEETLKLCNSYLKYVCYLHLPDGKIIKSNYNKNSIQKYMGNFNLTYMLASEVDHDNKKLNIYFLPIVESA